MAARCGKFNGGGSRLSGFQVQGCRPVGTPRYYAHSSRLRWLRSPEPANRAARIYPKLYYQHLLLAQTSSLASTPRVEVLIVSIALSAPNRLLLYCIHVVRYILAHNMAFNYNMAFNRPAEPAHMCLVHIRESEFIMVFQIPAKPYL